MRYWPGFAWMLVPWMLVVGCEAPPDRIEWFALELADGGRVADLVPAADTAAIVLVEPSHCFSCGGELSTWRIWQRQSSQRSLAVVLLRPPTDRESAELSRQRIPVTAALTGRDSIDLPAAFLFINGELRDSATGTSRSRALMTRWAP